MHQPLPFDDEDADLSPDAGFALRHALRRALAREIIVRRVHERVPAVLNGQRRPLFALESDEANLASYPRPFRDVA